MYRLLYALGAAIVLQGCSTHATTTNGCEDNFSTEGSLFTGKRFSTSAVLSHTPNALAYKKLYTILARDGYYIQSADESK